MVGTVGLWLLRDGVTPLGFAVAAVGLAIAAWGGWALRRSLTPFPTPAPDAQLVQGGPFRFLRHPIYVGGTLVFAGVSVAVSAWGLIGTSALGLFWIAKARHEERLLLERYPEYADYRRRTLF